MKQLHTQSTWGLILGSVLALNSPALASAALAQRLPTLDRIVGRSAAASGPSQMGLDTQVGGPTAQSFGACSPDWTSRFQSRAGVDGRVHAMIEYDDGTGSVLFVGGEFDRAGAVGSRAIARWDGAEWSSAAVSSPAVVVRAFAVFDDGSGPALYAGGERPGQPTIEPFVARWNGAGWTEIGVPGLGRVYGLAAFDDGTGPALYAAGQLLGLQATVGALLRWDGQAWSEVPAPPGPALGFASVYDLAVFDDGSGPGLFLGTTTPGAPTAETPIWGASGWRSASGAPPGSTLEFALHDDGSGQRLFLGGGSFAAGQPYVAELVGGVWVPADAGLDGAVPTFASIDVGGAQRLVAGRFDRDAPVPGMTLFMLNGAQWIEVAGSFLPGQSYVLVPFDEGGGESLFLGSNDPGDALNGLNHIARWSSNQWTPVGELADVRSAVDVATVFGTGADRRWVIVRESLDASGQVQRSVDGWNDSGWITLGAVDGEGVTLLKTLVENGREVLYVAGDFAAIDGVPIEVLARFDGTSWSNVGSGSTGEVHDVVLFDEGSGERLFAAGALAGAAGGVAQLARLDGGTWTAVASGASTSGVGRALAVYSPAPGQPQQLYLAGQFQSPVELTAPSPSFVRWNGNSLEGIGGGLSFIGGLIAGDAFDLHAHDFGTGLELVVVGAFESPASFSGPASAAAFDGGVLRPLGGIAPFYVPDSTNVLASFDDGSGWALYAASLRIGSPHGPYSGGLLRYEGTAWVGVPGDFQRESISSLAIFDDGSGRAIFCGRPVEGGPEGGSFVSAYRGCPTEVGEGYCTAVANSTGQAADLTAIGSTVVPEENLTLVASGLPFKSYGVFLVSRDAGLVPGYMGSAGTLCLGGNVGFFGGPGQVQQASMLGGLELDVDFTGLPLPGGAVPVAFGDTWNFQLWYRDVTPAGATSNFSSARRVAFE